MKPREDYRELIQDLDRLKDVDWSGSDLNHLANSVANVVDTARNCIGNLFEEIEDLEERIRRLERVR